MNLTNIELILSIIVATGTILFVIYKFFPQIKIEIRPVADNFYFGDLYDSTPQKKWTHRMRLDVFNHGFNTIILTSGELEVNINNESFYIDMFSDSFKKSVGRNETFGNVFIVSDLKLPANCNIRMVLKSSKGQNYKSNSISLDMFDPHINPL